MIHIAVVRIDYELRCEGVPGQPYGCDPELYRPVLIDRAGRTHT